MKDSRDNKRKKVSDKDAIITWVIDGKTVKKSYNERLKELRSQANQKTRDGDVIRSCGYSTKRDGSIQASARVEIPYDSAGIKDFAVNGDDPQVLKENAELKQGLEDLRKDWQEDKKARKQAEQEAQKWKDSFTDQAYKAIENNQLKAENDSGSSTTQILWLMVKEYKKAVLESVDKKRIYKKVFWNLKRFKKFKLKMYKKFDKIMFPKERSMEDFIRIAETILYKETKNEDYKPTGGRPTNEFKNYIPKYPEDIKPEPPTKMVNLNEEDWSRKSAPQIIKVPKDVDHDLD